MIGVLNARDAEYRFLQSLGDAANLFFSCDKSTLLIISPQSRWLDIFIPRIHDGNLLIYLISSIMQYRIYHSETIKPMYYQLFRITTGSRADYTDFAINIRLRAQTLSLQSYFCDWQGEVYHMWLNNFYSRSYPYD